MKKLNEGPTIKTDHKGSHLTNADGEVVQSFAKDRAGLKDARQAMYKNYKGLNRKTPAPEPVEEPVEEGIHSDAPASERKYRSELIDKIINLRPVAYNYDRIFSRYAKESTTFLEQELDYLQVGLPNRDKEDNWIYPQSATPLQRIDALLASEVINDEQHSELKLKYHIKTNWPIKDRGTNEYKMKEGIHDDVAQIKQQQSGDPRINLRRGEQVTKNEYRRNSGVNMPADNVTKMQSTRADFDADYDSKFGKFDWDKKPEFAKGTPQQIDTHNKIMAKRKANPMPQLTPQERDTYKQSRNAQTARANKQRVANGQTPFAMESPNINGYITEDKKMSALENKLKAQLAEGITVNTTSTNDENIEDNVTVTATGADAMELVQMLNMAGIGAPKAQEVEAPAEEMPCMSQPNEIDSMRDMISNMDNVEVIALDDIEAVEEEAELANAPDEKYADTDVLVNKISGGLNRRKKAYAKAENGDNPMAVTESEEELTTRLLKEYDEFKVTAPADSEEGNWEIENVGKWAVKIGNTENVDATDSELDLPFDTDLASALADEAMTEVKKPDADGDGIPDWADKDEECKYCGGECPQDEEHACDGYLGDIDNLYADEELQEDDVEEGLRMEFPDGSCEGSKCPDDRNRRKKPKKLDTDALDDEMSEDKS